MATLPDSSTQTPSETTPPPPLKGRTSTLPPPPSTSLPSSDHQPPKPDSSSPPPPPDPVLPSPSQQPQPAKPPVKTSPFKWVVPAIIALLVLSAIGFLVFKFVLNKPSSSSPSPTSSSSKPTPTSTTTITYQGLWETAQIMEPALQDFQKQNPHLKIDYQNQSSTDYRQRLQTTLSSKNPPDVVRLHSTWLPTFASLLQSAPQSLLSPSDLNSSFYPVVSDQVVLSNQVYGLPFTLDSLVLFVNHDLLQTAQSTVPTNWLDLQKLARRLTKTNPNTGQISQAGLSLGTTTNVDHWPDIVSLMLVQNGVDLGNLDSEKTLEALKFYLLFTTSQNPTWSPALPNSTQAFASGKLVFYIAPSWKIPTIQQVNPDFDWQTHPVPQLPQAPLANWASFWVEAVPKNAKNPQQAWQLIKYLSSTQAQQTIFQSATQVRGYAQPPSNKNLKNKISTNPLVSPVLEQLSSAQTFYTVGATHDGSTGINSRLIKYLEDALNALTKNPNDSQVMETLQKGFTQVLSQYQLNSTP